MRLAPGDALQLAVLVCDCSYAAGLALRCLKVHGRTGGLAYSCFLYAPIPLDWATTGKTMHAKLRTYNLMSHSAALPVLMQSGSLWIQGIASSFGVLCSQRGLAHPLSARFRPVCKVLALCLAKLQRLHAKLRILHVNLQCVW